MRPVDQLCDEGLEIFGAFNFVDLDDRGASSSQGRPTCMRATMDDVRTSDT